MKNKMKIGILGCGMIANIHAQAIALIEDAELIGVSDPIEASAKAFSEKYGVSVYKDYDAMLNDEEIDIVCICTPSGFHADGALKALNHNKHVVLEKPMALTTEDADAIVEASKKSGCLLTVISQLRFNEDIQKVKKMVEEGAFGDLAFCDLYMKYWRDPSYYASSTWKGTFKFDGGGALMNQGIHGVDLLHYMAGSAKVVKGKVKTLFHDIEVEDTATAIMEFENGALGVIEGSTCAAGGFDRKIEIIGTKGYVILREGDIEKMEIDGKVIIENDGSDQPEVRSSSDATAVQCIGHVKQITNLIRAIRGEEELLIDATEGRKAVKTICDIYASSKKDS